MISDYPDDNPKAVYRRGSRICGKGGGGGRTANLRGEKWGGGGPQALVCSVRILCFVLVGRAVAILARGSASSSSDREQN